MRVKRSAVVAIALIVGATVFFTAKAVRALSARQTSAEVLALAQQQEEARASGGLQAAAAVTGRYSREVSMWDFGGATSLRDLTANSSVIIVGAATSNRSRLSRDGQQIYTDYQFRVEDTLKGNQSDRTVMVRFFGGRVTFAAGTIAEIRPSFFRWPLNGERYLLFLKAAWPEPSGELLDMMDGELLTVFGSQGVYQLPGTGGARGLDLRRRPVVKSLEALPPGQLLNQVRAAVRDSR